MIDYRSEYSTAWEVDKMKYVVTLLPANYLNILFRNICFEFKLLIGSTLIKQNALTMIIFCGNDYQYQNSE